MVKPHSRDACCPPRPALRVPSLGHRAPLFRALGDPTRLDIVALLAAAGSELCACDIEAHFELAQSTISHHLRILRDAGLITGERRGTWVFYRLEADAVAVLASCCHALCPSALDQVAG